jgi:hypothetical protein
MEKNLIKYHIEKLQFVKRYWWVPINDDQFVVPNFDYASLYDTVMPTLSGELGIIMSPRHYTTNPCVEIPLNMECETQFNRTLTTFNLCDDCGGIEPLHQSLYSRRRLPSWEIINHDYPVEFTDDEQPF